MNIKYFKLISGEEIAAKVEGTIFTEAGMESVKLKDPVKLVLMPPMGLSFIGFCNFMKGEEAIIKKEHIMIEGELETEILNAYNEKFGSGIVISETNAIIQ